MYTQAFVRHVFALPNNTIILRHHSYRVAPSPVWPRLTGQTSWIDVGEGRLELDDHLRRICEIPSTVPGGPVQLPAPMVEIDSGNTSLPTSEESRRRQYTRSNTLSSSWSSTRSQASSERSSEGKRHRSFGTAERNKQRMKELIKRLKDMGKTDENKDSGDEDGSKDEKGSEK
jgi:hypothetical protein